MSHIFKWSGGISNAGTVAENPIETIDEGIDELDTLLKESGELLRQFCTRSEALLQQLSTLREPQSMEASSTPTSSSPSQTSLPPRTS